MTDRTWVITGGCGFIGSNLVRYVLEHRPSVRVVNIDNLSYAGNPDNVADVADDDRYEFHRVDIRDRAAVEPVLRQADCVFHLAAESHVDRSIRDATPFTTTNALGTQVLLDVLRAEEARSSRRPRFVYVSTDEVYGSLPLDKSNLKFTEETPLAPNSPYAASKAAGDMFVRAYAHTFGMDVVTTRCSNNFGPYQFPEKVIPLFVTRLLDGETVPLYGDGRNVRDWLHVVDHCEAIVAVAEGGRAGEVYNIGGDNERSNLELTRALLKICGRDEGSIRHVDDRLGHDLRYAIDASKIKQELGWVPSRSAWPDALEATVEWYRANDEWLGRVRSGEYRAYLKSHYGA